MKEELLKQFTGLIQELSEGEVCKDPQRFEAWKRKAANIRSMIEQLPPESFEWLDKEYQKWFNENLKDKAEQTRQKIQQRITEGLQKEYRNEY